VLNVHKMHCKFGGTLAIVIVKSKLIYIISVTTSRPDKREHLRLEAATEQRLVKNEKAMSVLQLL
jgi:hypothetical protein